MVHQDNRPVKLDRIRKSSGSETTFDCDLIDEDGRHGLGEETRQRVEGTARRGRRDHRDRALRPCLPCARTAGAVTLAAAASRMRRPMLAGIVNEDAPFHRHADGDAVPAIVPSSHPGRRLFCSYRYHAVSAAWRKYCRCGCRGLLRPSGLNKLPIPEFWR